MEMYQDYIKAVAEKNVGRVRSYIASAIRSDPTFSTGVVREYVDYAVQNGIALFETYEKTPCEMPVPENEELWDRRLFYGKVEDLRLNFAYRERIGQIKRIGRKVYGTTPFTEAPKNHRSKGKNKVVLLVAGLALLAVVAVVLYLSLR